MLKPIAELDRFPSFSKEPHAIASDQHHLWISSKATRRIDVIERDSFTKIGEIDPPGMPWGMTYGNGALAMTCGDPPDDTRRIRRFVPGSGFTEGYIDCPGDTGSHLAMYDGKLLLGQWYNRKLLLLDDDGSVLRAYDAPHGIAGIGVVGTNACVLGTDDEDSGEYWLSRIDLTDPNAKPEDLAIVPFHARGLAWDGSQWWTNYREGDRVIAFVLPG